MISRIAIVLVLTIGVMLAVRISAEDAGAKTSVSTGTGTAAKSGTAFPPQADNAASIVPNFDFECGSYGQPFAWGGSSGIDDFPLDNLTQFWASRPDGEGMCLKFDTDVYEREWKKRYDELKTNPKAKEWAKKQPVGNKYDTIGGLDGVRAVSKRIQVEKDKTYRLTAEVRSETGTKVIVFVKGYAEVGGRERLVYDAPKHCEPEKADLGKWKTYTRTFSPGESKGTVPNYIKIHVYAYWPAGIVYVDNILVTEEKEIKSPDAEEPEGKKEPPENSKDESKKDGAK